MNIKRSRSTDARAIGSNESRLRSAATLGVALLSAVAAYVFTAGAAWALPQTPSGLQVNGLSNPTAVTTTNPVFRAKYNDSNVLALARYYQVQVDKQGNNFSSPQWDSGQKTLRSYPPGTGVGTYIPNVQSTVSFLFDGTTYIWRIRLWDTGGTPSSYTSGADTFTMAGPPSAPTGVTADIGGGPSFGISWTDTSSDETGFTVQRRDDSGSGYGSFATVGTVGSNAVTFIDNSTNNPASPPATNRKYQYQVVATNDYGSNAAVSSDVYTAPAAPTIGTPTVDSSTAITWAWTDNAAFEESYQLGFTVGATTFIGGLATGLSSYQTTGLTPNTQHAVQVAAARTDRGAATSSASTALYTHANAPANPEPGGATVSALTLSWSTNGNPDGTEYYAENVGSGQSSGWTTNASWTATNLTCNTSYVLRVKARNGDAVETSAVDAAAASAAACPQPPGAPLPPPPPSGASSVSVDSGSPVTVETPEGSTVTVSGLSGSTFGPATISVAPLSVAGELARMPAPDQLRVVGDLMVEVKANIGVLPLKQLGSTVEVKLAYSDEQVKGAGVTESSVGAYRWDREQKQWVKVETSVVNFNRNTVTVLTGQTGKFAVFAEGIEAPAASTVEPPMPPPPPRVAVPLLRRSEVKLLRAQGSDRVYEVTPTGYLRFVPSEEAFRSYGYLWSQVQTVSQQELEARPITTVVKLPGDPRLYWLKDGTRRWISNPSLLEPLGLTQDQITEVSKIELDSYRTDATVYAPYDT